MCYKKTITYPIIKELQDTQKCGVLLVLYMVSIVKTTEIAVMSEFLPHVPKHGWGDRGTCRRNESVEFGQ